MEHRNQIIIDGIEYKAVPGNCKRGVGTGPFDECALFLKSACTDPKLLIYCSAQDRIDRKDVVWKTK